MMQPRQERGQQRRRALVSAAAEIAAEEGFAAVSHRTVARRAGVPLGSTTYYFTSLEDLLGAVADEMVSECLVRGGRLTEAAPAGRYSAEDAADLITRAVLPAETAPRVLCYYEQLLSAARYPAVAAVLQRSRPQLERMVGQALATTGFDGAASAGLVLSVVDGAALGALSEGRDDIVAFVAAAVTELLTRTTG